MKTCSKCGAVKALDQFSKLHKSKDGLQFRCKPCQNILTSEWYEANREKKIAADAARRFANIDEYHSREQARRDALKAQGIGRGTDWHHANKVHVAAMGKAYRSVNGDAIALRVKVWSDSNRPKLNATEAKRREAQVRGTPSWANMDAIQSIYEIAAEMRAGTGIPYEVDHAIPITSPLVCGLHCEANLQIITALDNRSKGNRHWPDMP
jgi:hypothetical protein